MRVRALTLPLLLGSAASLVSFTLGPEALQPYPSPHPYQFPDAAIAFVEDGPSTRQLYWSDGTTYRVTGPGALPANTPSPLTPVLTSGPKGSYDANGNWMLAVFRDPQSRDSLVGFTHVENHGFLCPGSYAEWNAGAVVTSEDNGATWARAGLAISDPQPCVPAFGGAGYSSVLQPPSGGGFLGYGGCTAFRSLHARGLPGTWQRWKGGAFASPGVNGTSDCLPGVPENACCPIVHYNTHLRAFVMLYDKWGQPGTIYLATSADGLSWGASQVLLQAAANRSIAYGQVLGEHNSSQAGQSALLAYAAAPPVGGEPRDFVYRTITFD
jgi:hypothetical protein